MLRWFCNFVLYPWTEWITGSLSHVAYLGRYAPGLGINSAGRPVEHWPLSRLHAYVKATSKIVEQENKMSNPKGSRPKG